MLMRIQANACMHACVACLWLELQGGCASTACRQGLAWILMNNLIKELSKL